jgi:tetratricopeptide (TPR) repeat protein
VRRAVPALVAALAAACSPASPAGSTTAPSPPGAQLIAALATAQQDMFDNLYTSADAAYARLLAAAPRSAEVHAAYALFLNYRGDSAAAETQARRAVSLDHSDGNAEAVLCRVLDWAGHFTDAVGAGRDATRLAPDQPLAHLFYAEALADTGDFTDSRTEIALAGRAIASDPTPFLRAEAQREQANLDGDLGDHSAQIAELQGALQLQPHWLFRTSEVVAAELADNQIDAAHQALDSVLTDTPDDAEALEALGNDALFIDDTHAATVLWAKALALAPTDPSVLDVNGELAVAAARDIPTAVQDFERALEADPADAGAAAYLIALGRYVQKQPDAGYQEIDAAIRGDVDPTSLREPPQPRPDVAASMAAVQALAQVNRARSAGGLPAVTLDPRLTASADSHAFYWLFNNLSASVIGLGIHEETPGLPGYSGVYAWTRAAAFGDPDPRIGEDITHRGNPVAAVNDWVDSVFHRFAIARPDLDAVGYAQAQIGSLVIEDMEFSFSPPAPAAPILYPSSDQSQVPAIFVDNELPDPLPAGTPRTTGYPVTVTFSQADTVHVSSFNLTGGGGGPLPAYLLSPSPSTENSAALIPVAPLESGATYTARIAATIDGRAWQRTWTFTTAG